MFVKPAPGLRIPDPQRLDYLPAEGRHIDASEPYWQRLLRDSDVLPAAPPEPPREAEAPPHPAQEG